MSFSINGTTINLTRGDTLKVVVDMFNENDEPYEPVEGDSLRFALKKSYKDTEPLILKDIPIPTCLLHLEPEDTKPLQMSKAYVYDIQLTHANGDVDTFISEATMYIMPEVE